MTVKLIIKKENLEKIKSGTKKTEWREPSVFNKLKLFKDRGDGKKDRNKNIKYIDFVNGYRKDAETIKIEVVYIRLVKFTQDIEIPEDNFRAKEGQFAIEIKLGNIVNLLND